MKVWQKLRRGILLCALALMLAAGCFAAETATRAAAADESNVVTIDLNGGMRTRNGRQTRKQVDGEWQLADTVEFTGDDLVGTIEGDTITFDHTATVDRQSGDISYEKEVTTDGGRLTFDTATVQTIFNNTPAYRYWDAAAEAYAGWVPKDTNYTAYDGAEMLWGVFTLGDGHTAEPNERGVVDYKPELGDTLYVSGDTVEIAGGETFYCYYFDNDIEWGTAVSSDKNKYVAVSKGWKKDFTPENRGEYRYYTPADLQPFFHITEAIGSDAFLSDDKGEHTSGNTYVRGVELPDTVRILRNYAFKGQKGLEYVTGLDAFAETAGNSSFGDAFIENSNPILELGRDGNMRNIFSDRTFQITAKQARFIFFDYDDTSSSSEIVKKGYSGPFDKNAPFWPKADMDDREAPRYFVYVPYGMTERWYPDTENDYDAETNPDGNQWIMMMPKTKPDNEPSINMPMREMFMVEFDLNGGTGDGGKVAGKDRYAMQYQDARAVSVKTAAGAERNVNDGEDPVLTVNPASAQVSHLYLTEPEAPAMPGKIFTGWAYYDADGTLVPFGDDYWGAEGASIAPLVNTTDAEADDYGKLRLVAQYADIVTVHFETNSTAVVNDVASYEGALLTEPDAMTATTGYAFGGWYKDAAFENAWDFASDRVAPDDGGSEMTLYAKWVPETYAITLDAGGGTVTAAGFTADDDGCYTGSYTFNEAKALPGAEQVERVGYTFAYWYFDGTPETPVTEIAAGEIGEQYLVAAWEAVEYAIEYELNGGTNAETNPDTYTVEDTVTLADASKPGYRFTGWFKNEALTERVTEISGTGAVKLYAGFEEISEFAIEYELNGGVNADTNPDTYTKGTAVTLANPTKDGYTFDGWYTTATFDADSRVTEISADTVGDVTLYAKFTEIPAAAVWNITYILNGGTNAAGNVATYTEGTALTLADPTRDGYTFDGWYTTATFDEGSRVTEISADSTGDVTLYAKFTASAGGSDADGGCGCGGRIGTGVAGGGLLLLAGMAALMLRKKRVGQ